MAKLFEGTVKEVLGTAHTMGLIIDGNSGPFLQRLIADQKIKIHEEGITPYVTYTQLNDRPKWYQTYRHPYRFEEEEAKLYEEAKKNKRDMSNWIQPEEL